MTALCFFIFFCEVRRPFSLSAVGRHCRFWGEEKNFFKKKEISVNHFASKFVLKTSYYICTVFSWY